MRTKVILLLTLFMSIILLPASSAGILTQNSTNPVTTFNNTATSSEAPDYKQGFSPNWTQSTTPLEEQVMQQNDTTLTPPSLTLYTTVSCSSTTCQRDPFSSSAPTNNTTTSSNKPNSNLMLFVILLVILVLVLFVGCLYAMRDQQSAQDSSAPRLLLGVRERLRAGIGNLEDWIGLHLWPGGKRGGEDEEEAEGRQGDAEEGGEDDGAEGGSGVGNEEKVEHKEEVTDSSDDYSSMEGDNLRERALNRWEEEEKKKSRNEDEEEISSASEAGQCAVEGESHVDKGGGSEEIALVNSPKEDDKKVDLSDVTVL